MSDEWRLEIKGAGAGANFLSGWSYRKRHALTGATGAGTNYQMKIIAHYGTGSDTDDDIYLSSKSRADFRDLRFTDDDGQTELDFWIESKTDSSSAVFWVEVADDLSSAQTIYVYYGNNTASYNSDGEDTFVFFDDFGLKIIDEPTNPVMIASEAWEGTAVIEPSLIMDGNDQCDMWYRGHPTSEQIGYASASDSKCAVWTKYAGNPLTDIPIGRMFPYVIKEGGIYYMFVGDDNAVGAGNTYLYSGTNKINWGVMNAGNPVLTHSTNSSDWYYSTFNVGVAVVDDVWHMLIEGKSGSGQFNVGYATSSLAELNWNAHISSTPVIFNAGNPHLMYVPDRSRLLSIHGDIAGSYWKFVAHYANPTDDLNLSTSWHSSSNFEISQSGIHLADIHLCVTNFTKDYNIIMNYCYDQDRLYQKYSEMSLNDFYDTIIINPLAKWSSATSSASFYNSIMSFHADTWGHIESTVSFSKPCVWKARLKQNVGAGDGFVYGLQSSDNANYTRIFDNATSGSVRAQASISGGSGSRENTISDIDEITYHNWDIRWKTDESKYYYDNVSKQTVSFSPIVDLRCWFSTDDVSSSATLSLDWNLIRKYADPEPGHGNYGSEETSAVSTKFDTYVPFYLEDKRQSKRINYSNIQIPNRATPITQLGSTDAHAIRVTGRIKLGATESTNDYEDGFTNVQWHTSTDAYRGEELYFYKTDDGTTSSRGTYHLVDYQIDETGGRKDWYPIRLNLIKHED